MVRASVDALDDGVGRTLVLLDDLVVMILDALADPYHGDKDWYLTDDGGPANPICSHTRNARGVKIKLQVSARERPVLPVSETLQVSLHYFKLLPFQPAPIPCLAFEDIVAEKIRAASQRSKIRDLYDLSEVATRPLQRDLTRSLAVLKLWNSGGPGLDFDRLRRRIQDNSSYDIADLRNLVRKDQNSDLNSLIRRVIDGFQFLTNLTDLERALAADPAHHRRQEADDLLRLIGGNLENG
jgi:hypothetical protein